MSKSRCLDVGSGTLTKGHKYVQTEKMLHVDIDKRAFHVEVVCDAHYLPFMNDVFELVHASHILEHVDSPLMVIRELGRVSKGQVVIRVPNASHYNFMTNPEESEGHIYSWNICTFKHLLEKCFLKVRVFSSIRSLVGEKVSKVRTLKMISLRPLISTNELTAICTNRR